MNTTTWQLAGEYDNLLNLKLSRKLTRQEIQRILEIEKLLEATGEYVFI